MNWFWLGAGIGFGAIVAIVLFAVIDIASTFNRGAHQGRYRKDDAR